MQTEDTKPGKLMRIINYSIATLFALLGILVLIGYPKPLPDEFRWLLGGVLLLWAIYRGITARTKFPIS